MVNAGGVSLLTAGQPVWRHVALHDIIGSMQANCGGALIGPGRSFSCQSSIDDDLQLQQRRLRVDQQRRLQPVEHGHRFNGNIHDTIGSASSQRTASLRRKLQRSEQLYHATRRPNIAWRHSDFRHRIIMGQYVCVSRKYGAVPKR